MSKKNRKSYSREVKLEAVGLITKKGYSIAEASRNLGIEYSVLRRWKMQLADDPHDLQLRLDLLADEIGLFTRRMDQDQGI